MIYPLIMIKFINGDTFLLYLMPSKLLIPKTKLKNLYLHQKLSSSQIAKMYNCSAPHIRNKLSLFNIPIRNLSEAKLIERGILIQEETLKKLYISKKLSAQKIANLYNCNEETIRLKLHKFGIPVRSRFDANTIFPRCHFSGNLVEKSYLIGFRLGDLWVGLIRKNSQTIVVRSPNLKIEQMELIKNLFINYGRVKVNDKDIRGAFKIRCHVDMTFDFLLPKKDEIPDWVYSDDRYFIAFLAGYVDAEGHMGVRKDQTSHLVLSSYDKKILHQIYYGLNRMGIICLKPKMNRAKGYKDSYGVRNGDRWGTGVYRKKSLLLLLQSK